MSKHTQLGYADAMRILQAEYAQEQRDLESVRKKLDAGSVSANDAANLQMEIVRRRDNLRALEREMQNWTKRTGVSQSASVQPTPASPPSSARVSVSGPAAAIPSAPAAGGIGEYVTGIIRNQMERQDAAIKAQQKGVTDSAQADAAVTMANNDRSNAINSNRLLVQAQAGLGPQAKEDMYAATMAKLAENDQKYAVARAKYDEYATANLMEDPLGWIWGRLNMGSAAAQVNKLAAQENILTAALERNMLLSEKAETTIQIDTRETDRQIADFQARKQLADGAARVAALEAEGARASMSAAATYGGELRKDETRPLDTKFREMQMQEMEERIRVRITEREERERAAVVLGTPHVEKSLNDIPPTARPEVENFIRGGAASPDTVVKYLNGTQGTPVRAMAERLQAAIDEQARQYVVSRGSGNAVLTGKVTWAPAKDREVAWDAVRTEIEATNADRGKTAVTLTGNGNDKAYNPLRGDAITFAQSVRKRAAAGVPTDVPAGNVMVHMYSRMADVPNSRAPLTGQIRAELERNGVLGSIANMAIEGKVVDQNGKPITPAGYASMVSQFYRAHVKDINTNSGLSRLGFREQKSYIAAVPVRTLNGDKLTLVIDLTKPSEIENWLEAEIKTNAAQHVKQQLDAKMLEVISTGLSYVGR